MLHVLNLSDVSTNLSFPPLQFFICFIYEINQTSQEFQVTHILQLISLKNATKEFSLYDFCVTNRGGMECFCALFSSNVLFFSAHVFLSAFKCLSVL